MASRKIMVGVPAYDGRVDVEFAHSLTQSIKLCARHGIELCDVYWPGEALVQHARNMLVKMALECQAEAMLCIDADQSWEPQAALALINHKYDVVGCPVVKRSESESYNVRNSSPFFAIDSATSLWIAEGIGTGFLKLSRTAMQALWDNSEPYTKAGQDTRMLFDVGIVEGHLVGEDYAACVKLRALDFRILLDPNFTIQHKGSKNFKGDFRAWVERLKAQQQQRKAG